MTPRSRFVLAVVTAPLAVALAGCASGSSPAAAPSASGSAASSPATAPTPGTVTSQSPSPAGPVTPGGPMATATATSPATSHGRTSECTAAQLAVAYTNNQQIRDGALDGMSHADSVITFTNVSHRTCWTRGYPGVAALDSSGRQIKQAVRRKAQNGQTPLVTLAPGRVASAEVTGNSASCTKLTTFPALLVTAPDQRTSVRLPGKQVMCLNTLGITPLQPGDAAGLSL
jgi:hypothetical protein